MAQQPRGPHGQQEVTATAFFHAVSYTSGKLTGSLTFDNNVTGIDRNDFEVLNASNVVQTGWIFDSPPSTATANVAITISATPPSNTNASFKLQLKANSVIGPGASAPQSPLVAVPSVAVAVDNRGSSATAAWSNIRFSGQFHRITGILTFNVQINGLTNDDFEVLDSSDVVQSGWSVEAARGSIDRRQFRLTATPPPVTLGNFKVRLKANSVTTDDGISSPSSNVDTSAVYVQNILQLQTTLNGSFGGLSLHANFVSTDTHCYVVNNNIIRAFRYGAGRFDRRSVEDITLAGHPSSIVTWGFDQTDEGDWVILTRERNTITGSVGRVYVYSSDGSTRRLMFDIPSSVTGISGETFRAPKSVSYWQDEYFVRVVRSVSGNMRFLTFDSSGTVLPEKSIVLADSDPATMRDAASSDASPLYILTPGAPGAPVGIAYPINPQTGGEVANERLVAQQLVDGAEGISVTDTQLAVATLTNVYLFSGVPPLVRSAGADSSGALASLLNIIAVNARMEGNMNRRDRR